MTMTDQVPKAGAAAIYCRISDDRKGDALGVARQEQDGRALAERRGWAVAGLYVDNDVSAYSGKPRPEYRRLLENIQRGAVDALIAWHPDRLHRSPLELEEFIDIIEAARIPVVTVQGGEYDLSTASGRMTARVVGAVARHESEHKSERIRRKHEELAKGGAISRGGDRAFGYDHDRVTVRPAEARL
ncbi:MAG: recombinase family protein, partial [Chloroflexota bacterium]|nr:recombinase family protein [Chloroflexota bacterium]